MISIRETSWREPASRLQLSVLTSDEPVQFTIGSDTFRGRRWTRVIVTGPPNARHRKVEPGLIDAEELEESWCAVDCGEAGTVILSHRWHIRAAVCGPHWLRDMSVRLGPDWLYGVFCTITPGSTRDHLLTPVRLLPATSLGRDECTCESDELDWLHAEYDNLAGDSLKFDEVPLDAIEKDARRLVASALGKLDGGVRLVKLRAAALHSSTSLLNEYTGDTFTTDSLRLSCDVTGSGRFFRLVLSFSDGDMRSDPATAPQLARRVLAQNLAHEPAWRVWLVDPTTDDADALGKRQGFEPAGTPLDDRPRKTEFAGWQTAWAETLLGPTVLGRLGSPGQELSSDR